MFVTTSHPDSIDSNARVCWGLLAFASASRRQSVHSRRTGCLPVRLTASCSAQSPIARVLRAGRCARSAVGLAVGHEVPKNSYNCSIADWGRGRFVTGRAQGGRRNNSCEAVAAASGDTFPLTSLRCIQLRTRRRGRRNRGNWGWVI